VSWPWLPERTLSPIPDKKERHRLLAWGETEYARLVEPLADGVRA